MNNPRSFAIAFLFTLLIIVILARRPRSSHVPGIDGDLVTVYRDPRWRFTHDCQT